MGEGLQVETFSRQFMRFPELLKFWWGVSWWKFFLSFLLIFWAVHDISQTFLPTKIPPGVGWVNFFTWEWVPYLSEYVCQIWLRSDGRVEKKGVQSTDRQTDKGTLQLYLVDVTSYSVTPYYVTSDYFTVSFAYGWLSYQCYPIIVFTTNDSTPVMRTPVYRVALRKRLR